MMGRDNGRIQPALELILEVYKISKCPQKLDFLSDCPLQKLKKMEF